MEMQDELILVKQTQIAILKKKIDYEEKVRKDRRWNFEQWDKNSAALIEQHKKELADLEK